MAETGSAAWRSSKALSIFTATLGLFTENFLFGFIVPLLPYMIEHRLGLPPSSTQRTTTALLSTLGLISILAAPIIGHLADLAPSRKLPLLLSLAVGVAGTLLVATTISLPAIFAGRVLQGLSGTGAWIICFAMLTDAAGGKHLGKMLGFAGSFITGGIVIGPAAGGVLLQVVGYWPAWSVPLALLAIGLVARLCMIEEAPSPPMMKKDTATPSHSGEDVESAPLISDTTTTDSDENDDIKHRGASSRPNFYTVVLTQPKAWAAMFNVVAFALILSGFDATLPLHLRNTFGWKPAQIGSIFLGIQVPGMVLGPFIGWLRDSIGLRWPVTIGWLLTAPLLWFSGVPGRWEGVGQGAFVGCIIAVGVVMTLVRGAGTFALTTTLHELRAKDPHVFGPGGGSSKMFSLTEISFNIGLTLGPLVCGSLSDAFGFEYTASTLAGVSLFVACTSCVFFEHKSISREDGTNEEE